MSFTEAKRESMKRYMLEKIRNDDEKFVAKTAENFGISITSVNRYIKKCIEDKIIELSAETKTGYRLISHEYEFFHLCKENVSEDKIYYQEIEALIQEFSKEVNRIWGYAFMEMMNNAIEHAKASQICIYIKKDYLYTEISIIDDGIGIFRKMKCHMEEKYGTDYDYEDMAAELYKGKFTTDSKNHSGEGIFFTSKMLDCFCICSDNAVFSAGYNEEGGFGESHLISYYTKINKIGTLVFMRLANESTCSMREVFDMFAPMDEGFVRTTIPVKKACPHGEPIARSQARRMVQRLEEFKRIEFDFTDIEFMGQGFADEVFRVFQNKHKDIQLIPVNANSDVLGMIKHVTARI